MAISLAQELQKLQSIQSAQQTELAQARQRLIWLQKNIGKNAVAALLEDKSPFGLIDSTAKAIEDQESAISTREYILQAVAERIAEIQAMQGPDS